MFSEANAVQTLTKFDLSLLESRIYIALCKYESLTTKELSKLTQTAQPDVYRVLYKLQNKGLVEKIIEKPTRFKAVPLEKGISYLVQRKKAEHKTLLADAEVLIHSFKELRLNPKHDETSESKFIMIPQREIIVSKIREAINRSEETVDIYLTWKRFINGFTSVFLEDIERAWKKGVHFRIVVESPQDKAALKQAAQFTKKSPFCLIRFLPNSSKTVTGIYDKKEIFIIVNPAEDLFDSPALWSNNQSLITAMQEYFDLLWLISMEYPNQKLDIISEKGKTQEKTVC
jgi:sugar-specific transcriptional regulator TrmB